jgi:hypothetical protein
MHRDYSGVKVELLGTNLQAFTDDQGLFVIDSVPPGSYTVAASMEGYDSVIVTELVILPPDGAYVLMDWLLKRSDVAFSFTFASVQFANIVIGFEPELSQSESANLALYFARTRNVGPAWEDYDAVDQTSLGQQSPNAFSISSGSLKLPSVIQGKRGFQKGDSVYVVGYTYRGYVRNQSYVYRYTNLRNRTNVVGFVMP